MELWRWVAPHEQRSKAQAVEQATPTTRVLPLLRPG
jgi:hypothetical protein